MFGMVIDPLSILGSIMSYITSFIIYIIAFAVIYYFFIAYMLYKIARKYNNGTAFGPYVVPFYRYYLVMKYIGVDPWLMLGMSANLVALVLANYIKSEYLFYSLFVVAAAFMGCLWAMVGRSMNRNAVLWGIVGGVCSLSIFGAWVPYIVFALTEMQPAAKSAGVYSRTSTGAPRPNNPSTARELYGIGGMYAGQTIPITSDAIAIGRDPSRVNLVIDNPDVSRLHARISIGRDGLLIEDLGSSNGTFIVRQHGAERIKGVLRLNTGDRFYLGSKTNTFEVR